MKRFLTFWSVLVILVFGMLAVASEPSTTPVIDKVRIGSHQSGHTRVVVELDAEPVYKVVPVEGVDPVVELRIEGGSTMLSQTLPEGVGSVSAVAAAENVVRFRLAEPALPVRRFVLAPTADVPFYRLVIDLDPVSRISFAAAASERGSVFEETAVAEAPLAASQNPERQADLDHGFRIPALRPDRQRAVAVAAPLARRPAPRSEPVFAAERRSRPLIVLDPGHGGRDPGAVGKSGLTEARVTWAAAGLLRDALTARGYEVLMTRSADEYVALDDRIRVARDSQADMFVSIHADANPVPEARGASVYTLSQKRSRRMESEIRGAGDFKLFAQEMKTEDKDVSTILFDIAKNDTANHSGRLASAILDRMEGRLPLVNNSHRTAGLAVLLSPDVPAVLVELAFLSNADDEKNLGSTTWRRMAAAVIADGIDTYFDAHGDAVAHRQMQTAVAN